MRKFKRGSTHFTEARNGNPLANIIASEPVSINSLDIPSPFSGKTFSEPGLTGLTLISSSFNRKANFTVRMLARTLDAQYLNNLSAAYFYSGSPSRGIGLEIAPHLPLQRTSFRVQTNPDRQTKFR
jgi:hypothetical protein